MPKSRSASISCLPMFEALGEAQALKHWDGLGRQHKPIIRNACRDPSPQATPLVRQESPRSSVAQNPRSLCHLDRRNHAPADPGRHGFALLRTFLRQLPNVHALDRAPLRTVLALWSGLGYYRRAENLKKSAREIVRKYGGHLPDSYDALLALPGVGDYTAGALMSIAFQRSYPAIDGNARRVLDRLLHS